MFNGMLVQMMQMPDERIELASGELAPPTYSYSWRIFGLNQQETPQLKFVMQVHTFQTINNGIQEESLVQGCIYDIPLGKH